MSLIWRGPQQDDISGCNEKRHRRQRIPGRWPEEYPASEYLYAGGQPKYRGL